eukprot:CAMPEP_0184497386 /NCGR_PEP_ID=MMETSP0113_2-20130426/36408_1 /TAXON_ID=91329 /ORGANISM="Norrisiella sphaerica, Strain BC52" /LENGTH=499 /DNA_ID=CAMNT_0026884475 /DNA_START=92 /DNA_END=1588 /DNA_ORIENTATION=-
MATPALELKLTADSFEAFEDEQYESGELRESEIVNTEERASHEELGEPKYEKKWVKYLLILGSPPPLTSRQWKVFGLLSLAGMMTTYDDTLKSVALEQIQESLDIPDRSVSFVIAIVRLGVLLAVLLSLAADRFGRRPMLLATICGFALMSAVTAGAINVVWFTITQFLAKMFLHTEYLLSNVSILEEFDTGTRGWAVGAVSALCVMGSGLCIVMYGPIGGYPYGWRILYAVGVIPLLVLAYLRRNLPETRMFENKARREQAAANEAIRQEEEIDGVSTGEEIIMTEVSETRNSKERGDEEDAEADFKSKGRLSQGLQGFSTQFTFHLERFFKPMESLGNYYFLLAKSCLLLFVRGFCGFPAEFFMFKVLQERYGYSTLEVTAITIGGGAVSVFAYVSAGRLSDSVGRKPVLSVIYATYFSFLVIFYNSGGGWFTVLSWILFAASMFGLDVLNAALVSETFPTSARATASTISVVVGVIGTILGLVAEGLLFDSLNDHW